MSKVFSGHLCEHSPGSLLQIGYGGFNQKQLLFYISLLSFLYLLLLLDGPVVHSESIDNFPSSAAAVPRVRLHKTAIESTQFLEIAFGELFI